MADIKSIRKRLQTERKRFRSEENTHYYSRKDFKAAEKQFLIECVLKDHCHEDAADEITAADSPQQTKGPHRQRRPDVNGGQQDGDTK